MLRAVPIPILIIMWLCHYVPDVSFITGYFQQRSDASAAVVEEIVEMKQALSRRNGTHKLSQSEVDHLKEIGKRATLAECNAPLNYNNISIDEVQHALSALQEACE